MKRRHLMLFFKPPFVEWILWMIRTTVIYKKNSTKNISIGARTRISNLEFGNYVLISPDCSIANSKIGNYSYLASSCDLANVTIGNFCSVGPCVKMGIGMHPTYMVSTHPAFYSKSGNLPYPSFSKEQHYEELAPVLIGNDVFIGANSIILNGIKVGTGAVISAGSVVVKDVEDYSIVGGVPAKHIKYRFSPEIIQGLLNSEWWFKDDSFLKENSDLFLNPETFLAKLSSKN